MKIWNDLSTVNSQTSISEKKIIQSISQTPTIRKLLQTIPEEMLKDRFKKMLGIIATTSGIKNAPDDILKGLLWNYFKTYLVGYTMEDITLAFMLNAAGEFETKADHFQLLDINFFSSVMDQYLKMKSQAVSRVKMLQPKPVEVETSPEESYQGLKEYFLKHNSFPEFWSWTKVYFHMQENDMIPDDNDQKKEQYQAELTRLYAKAELEILSDIKDAVERAKLLGPIPDQAKVNCRKALVQKYLIRP